MATFISFTTTPRTFRSDALNHPGKLGVSNIAGLTDFELNNVKTLIAAMFDALRVSNVDVTTTCSLSLTSGSVVVAKLTT